MAKLEALLDNRPDGRLSWLDWLRCPVGMASASSYRELVARLGHLRTIGIEPARAHRVPAARLTRLAAEGERLSLGHLQGRSALRRRAVFIAVVLELMPRLTDDAFDLQGKLVGRMFRRAERRQTQDLTADRRLIGRTMRAFAQAGRALIQARAEKASLEEAVGAAVGWERFGAAVEDAGRLATRHARDLTEQLGDGHRPVRQCLPLLLATFELRGVPAVHPLLAAFGHLRGETQEGRRRHLTDAPTDFMPAKWRPFVLGDGVVDRRAYELCAMAELRGALLSGDVWVAGSRRYRSIEDELVPVARIAPAPDAYLEATATRLGEALRETERLGTLERLPDAVIKGGRLMVSPLRADTPAEALRLHETLYGLLPRVRITELLEEVDRWTGFSQSFTHLKTGLPAAERPPLLTAVLADGINLGLRRSGSFAAIPSGGSLRNG